MSKENKKTDEQVLAGVSKYGLTALFENIGEGLAGDYVASDPNDENLLRLRIFVNDDEEIEGTSFCTMMPAAAPAVTQAAALEYVLDQINEVAPGLADADDPDLGPVRKLCERLSWISPKNMTP